MFPFPIASFNHTDRCKSPWDSHRHTGARLSHTHRICKGSNNDPLVLMIENWSGVNAPIHMLMAEEVVAYIDQGLQWCCHNPAWSLLETLICARTPRTTANMVKYFSVDWMIQTDSPANKDLDPKETSSAQLRPHVPCVVQPRQPTSFDRSYLQPKPKVKKSLDFTEKSTDQDSSQLNMTADCRPVSCSSPSK